MKKDDWEKTILNELEEFYERLNVKESEKGKIKTGEENGEYFLETNYRHYIKWKWFYDEKFIQSAKNALESDEMKLIFVSKEEVDDKFGIKFLFNINGEEKEFFVYEDDKKFCFDIKEESYFHSTTLTDSVIKQVPKIVTFLENYLKEMPKYRIKFAIRELEFLYIESVLKVMIVNSTDKNSYLSHPIEAFNRPFLYLRINEMLNLKKIGVFTLGDILKMTKRDIKKVKNISQVDEELQEAILEIQEDFGSLFNIK